MRRLTQCSRSWIHPTLTFSNSLFFLNKLEGDDDGAPAGGPANSGPYIDVQAPVTRLQVTLKLALGQRSRRPSGLLLPLTRRRHPILFQHAPWAGLSPSRNMNEHSGNQSDNDNDNDDNATSVVAVADSNLRWAVAAGVLVALVLVSRYADTHGSLPRITPHRLRTTAIVAWVLLHMLWDIAATILRWTSAFLVDVASDLVTFPRFLCDASMFEIVAPKKCNDQDSDTNKKTDGASGGANVELRDAPDDGGGKDNNNINNNDEDDNDDDLCYVVIGLMPWHSMPFGGLESSKDVDLLECNDAPPPVLGALVGGSSLARPGMSGAYTTPSVVGGGGGTPAAAAADPQTPVADAAVAASTSNAVVETAWEAFHLRLRFIWLRYMFKSLAFFLYGLFWIAAAAWWASASNEDSGEAVAPLADPTSSLSGWIWARAVAWDVMQSLALQGTILAMLFTVQVLVFACWLLFHPLLIPVCALLPGMVSLWQTPASDGAGLPEDRLLRLAVMAAKGLVRAVGVRCVMDYWSHVLRRTLDRVVREWKPSFGAQDVGVQVKVFRTRPRGWVVEDRRPNASKLQTAARWAQYFCADTFSVGLCRHEKFCLAFRRKRHGV